MYLLVGNLHLHRSVSALLGENEADGIGSCLELGKRLGDTHFRRVIIENLSSGSGACVVITSLKNLNTIEISRIKVFRSALKVLELLE